METSNLNLSSLSNDTSDNTSGFGLVSLHEQEDAGILDLSNIIPSLSELYSCHASYGFDYTHYSLPSLVEAKWDFVLGKLKPIAEGGAKLREIYIAIGSFIKTFGKSSTNEQSQPSEDEETGMANLFLLNKFLNCLNNDARREIIDVIIPFIAKLVLKSKTLFSTPFKSFQILSQGTSATINLNKEKCACLMAHMFFCLTMDHNNKKLASLRNFSKLYTDTHSKIAFRAKLKMEKLKFIFNYFRRIMDEEMAEKELIFSRVAYPQDSPNLAKEAWNANEEKLTKVEISDSAIPEHGIGGVQVSFSDKQVGDQTLSLAATQHQIMLLTYPELIVSVLFCETLENEEALIVKGAEKYSVHSGFSNKFAFEKDFKDNCSLVSENLGIHLDREFVMIDASNFKKNKEIAQFSEAGILRELNKAYIGFVGDDLEMKDLPRKPIWTGKWGCGVFGGNVQLKFIIQWLAASRAKRDMNFFLFEDKTGLNNVDKFVEFFQEKNVGTLMKALFEYLKNKESSSGNENDIFEALKASSSL